jgi:hypothetical protein
VLRVLTLSVVESVSDLHTEGLTLGESPKRLATQGTNQNSIRQSAWQNLGTLTGATTVDLQMLQ